MSGPQHDDAAPRLPSAQDGGGGAVVVVAEEAGAPEISAPESGQAQGFQVRLENFSGPFDLLLS
ncbi:MAG: hypothetical protein J7474_08845, partial [Arthrobacter sp.]|nr:hypothetical protein [Arthrobacter sp.]